MPFAAPVIRELPRSALHHADSNASQLLSAPVFCRITFWAILKRSARLAIPIINGKKIYRKRSPITVNWELTLLSSIFRMAKKEKVATYNPCEDLPRSVRKKIPARYRRNRYLRWDEEKQLFKMGLIGRREHLRPLVQLAIWTGMRRGELLRLEINHVNLGMTQRTFTVKVSNCPGAKLTAHREK